MREPERCTVAGDATVSVEGVSYEVEPQLAGETVTLLWGLFGQVLYVKHGGSVRISRRAAPSRFIVIASTRKAGRRSGSTAWCGWPTQPQTHSVSASSACPGRHCREATGRLPSLPPGAVAMALRSTPFPEAPTDTAFPSRLATRFAIADLLGHPLGRLGPEDLGFIDVLLSETLGVWSRGVVALL